MKSLDCGWRSSREITSKGPFHEDVKVRWQLPKWAVLKWKCESESPWGEGFAFLVTQWEIICLPIQETRVSLVQEDPTCLGATKPMSHKYWPCALESCSLNYWAHVPHLLKPASSRTCAPQEKPLQWEAHALCSHGFFVFFFFGTCTWGERIDLSSSSCKDTNPIAGAPPSRPHLHLMTS